MSRILDSIANKGHLVIWWIIILHPLALVILSWLLGHPDIGCASL